MFDESLLRILLKNTPIGYALIKKYHDGYKNDISLKILDVNPAFKNITGLDDNIIHKELIAISKNNPFVKELLEFINPLILTNENLKVSNCFETFNLCLNIYAFSPMEDIIILQIIDNTREKNLENKLIHASYHDKLTGLYNRAFFEEEMKRLDTNRNLPISIIMGDTNGLKLINDIFGHDAGDKLIKSTADILLSSCRHEDIIARWGGDEFIILLPKTSIDDTEKIIQRIKSKFKLDTFDQDYLNISLGYSTKTNESKTLSELIMEAEDNMYKNKSLEGQRVRSLIVNSMVDYLYEGDIEVKKSMDRLKRYAIALGRLLHLSEEELNKLYMLCEVHDIGLISVDKKILFKSDELTEDEWEEIKKHPEVGYRISKSIPELTDIANQILYHHERWDGEGYPHNLKSEDIPLLSRIFSIVDVYDAMTQDKSYRKAYTKSYALQYIKDNAGLQFDPHIVDVFINKLEIF